MNAFRFGRRSKAQSRLDPSPEAGADDGGSQSVADIGAGGSEYRHKDGGSEVELVAGGADSMVEVGSRTQRPPTPSTRG
jgi:hypothetical protein